MGLVICKKHGVSGIDLVCPHLSKKIWSFENVSGFVQKNEVIVDEAFNVEDEGYYWDWTYYLCASCDKQYKKNSFEELPIEFIKGVCGNCFKVLRNIKD
jgi:hypothetical protein